MLELTDDRPRMLGCGIDMISFISSSLHSVCTDYKVPGRYMLLLRTI